MRKSQAARRFIDALPAVQTNIDSLIGRPGTDWYPLTQEPDGVAVGTQYCRPGRAAGETPLLVVTRWYGFDEVTGELLATSGIRDVDSRGSLIMWPHGASEPEHITFARPQIEGGDKLVRVSPDYAVALRLGGLLPYAQVVHDAEQFDRDSAPASPPFADRILDTVAALHDLQQSLDPFDPL